VTAKKYISITKTTKATATRDLQELVKNEILMKEGDGRSTHYLLNL
jgi:Fic family protein